MFQHQGAWAMRAYARAATRPRGTVIAQVPCPLPNFAPPGHAMPANLSYLCSYILAWVVLPSLSAGSHDLRAC